MNDPTAIDERPSAALWARYRSNFARSLMGVVREYNRSIMARLQAQPDYRMLRLSFEAVVSTLAFGPLRASGIAARLGISKQHASQLIGEAEKAGLVEKRADPRDSRARQIALTALGERLVSDGAAVAAEVSAEFASYVDAGRLTSTLRHVHSLCEALQLPSLLPEAPALIGARPGVIGNDFMRLSDYVQDSLMTLCIARNFSDLKVADGRVLMHMGSGGARLRDLATINDMTPQGIGRIVRDLEQRGYVCREADPADARGIVLQLTSRGRGLIAASVDSVDDLYGQLAELIGDDAMASLDDTLGRIYQTLEPAAEDYQPNDAGLPAAEFAAGESLSAESLSLYLAYRLAPANKLVKPYGDASRAVTYSDGVNPSLKQVGIVPEQFSRQLEQHLGQDAAEKLDAMLTRLAKLCE